jgi:hypothetical protein
MRALWASGRNLTDVAYGMRFWVAAPRQMSIDGRRIRLGGFPDQDQQLLRLNDAWQRARRPARHRPRHAPALAERALRITGRSGNRLRTGEILPAAAAEIDRPYRLGCVDPLTDAVLASDGGHTDN